MIESQHEDVKLLSFGFAVGGRSASNELVIEALTAIGRRVAELRDNHPNSGLKINVVFQLPGPISKPDYEGVQVRKLDRKRELLLVHAAVPVSLGFDDAPEFVADVLSRAREQATAYLEKKRIALSTEAVGAVITEVINELPRSG